MTVEKSLEALGLRLVADHIGRVQQHMSKAIALLLNRAAMHDSSKYSLEELPLVIAKPLLDSLEYQSDAYTIALANVKTAVAVHYANNSHHPEHYTNGVAGMSLFDLIEMLCDWKAAGEVKADGSMEKSIALSVQRFNLSPELVEILRNTTREMGW